MGLDMTLYHEGDKDFWETDEVDSSRCPYFRNERVLHHFILRYAKAIDESNYELTKENLCDMLIEMLPSIMEVYAAAMDAHKEISLVDEEGLPHDALFREYYVIGKLLSKKIRKEVSDLDECSLTLLNGDDDGMRLKKFVNDIIGLVERLKDGEKVIYNYSC